MYNKLATPTGAAEMRGTVDFTNATQFTLAEKGHSLIAVLDTPIMMDAIKAKYSSGPNQDDNLVNVITNFPKIIESEFKGLDGLDDMTADSMEVSDNITTLEVLGAVNYATNQEITMRFTEKAGRTLTKYATTYLTGIRDPRTRVKTYKGCIAGSGETAYARTDLAEGKYTITPGFDKEIFTFLYIIPDNTWTRVENAYLLTNAQLTKAPYSSLDNFDKGDIGLVEIDLTFKTFVIANNENVYAMAQQFLNDFVSREKYTAGAWNIDSDTLQYTVFGKVATNNVIGKTAAGATKVDGSTTT